MVEVCEAGYVRRGHAEIIVYGIHVELVSTTYVARSRVVGHNGGHMHMWAKDLFKNAFTLPVSDIVFHSQLVL
jgi:hypothetical protein